MRSILLLSVITFAFFLTSSSQEQTNSPALSGPAINVQIPDVIIIPVVVHVVYNTPGQNISNDQVKSQIKVLNEDFRRKNKDAAYIPAAFKNFAADARIEFRLATIDPSGLPTDGIVRKSTAVSAFGMDDKIKSSLQGGDDPWNRDDYLNLWVGNLSGGTMGYASVPGCAPEKDGVVIKFTAFGNTPNLQAPFNRGRTAVHEIGHWLGLRHIWGDADCGDDKIDDTPPQAGPTRGCPSGVIATCSSGAAGNMYMNFMDFTNDDCTNMFTLGQAARMRELFNAGGARAALLRSVKAEGAVGENSPAAQLAGRIKIYPNPAVDKLNIQLNGSNSGYIVIYNNLGQIAKTFSITKNLMDLDISSLKNGMYFISIAGKGSYKFIKGE
ncbi:MAG: T9SS type A sorting domain-containing protein [Chitinophagaceae bacterium]|nr:T9SS type A sorting domain-containing protein [Chitinophagaceae bacterium]